MRTAECAEIVALDVFNRPDRQPVTMSLVQPRIGELQTHRPSCQCMFGLNRINREFVEFQKRQSGGGLDEFLQFLVDPILTPMERKRTERMNNPDSARTISYADPTGEKATKNVYDKSRNVRI